jgi:phosphohistidine phosphatase
MRHAEAVDRHPGGDRNRVLTAQGRNQAHNAGTLLARMGLVPSAIIHSGAARTVETMRCMEAAWKNGVSDTSEDTRLYSLPSDDPVRLFDIFSSIIARARDEARCLLVLGHNPSISHLAFLLNRGHAWPFETGYPPASSAIFSSEAESWTLLAPENCIAQGFILNGDRFITSRG